MFCLYKLLCCFGILSSFLLGSTCEEYFSEDNLSAAFLKKHLTAEYTSKLGKKVYVFDDVVSHSLLLATRAYFSFNDDWRYVLFDKFVVDPSGKYDHGNGIPWKSWQNPTVLSGTRIGSVLKALVTVVSSDIKQSSTNSKREFHLTEFYSAILRRGDVTQLHRDIASAKNTSVVEGYSAVLYTNTIWRKNSYGEILFFEDEDDYDVFSVVSPHCGRFVLWDSSIRYLSRPPSINEVSGQYMLFAQFYSDPKLIYEKRTHFDDFLFNLKNSRDKTFVCEDNVDKVPKLDLKKLLTLQRYNKAGETVAVFDGLFNKSDLDALRTYTVKFGKYFYDDHIDLTSDNVQWIAGFEVKKFVNSRFWPIIKQVATYVSGKDTWYPYDIACNLIRSTDHTRFHLDTSEDTEEEMTFLLYLNPNWTAANYGETAFMELNYDYPDNDYVAEVVPEYGRAVIFGGNFPHSAHPPAPDYGGPRYTLAVKLSANRRIAIIKSFEEESRHSLDDVTEMLDNLKANPSMFATQQKISIVSSFLTSKQIQNTLDKKLKTPKNIEEAMGSTDEKDDDLNQFKIDDGEWFHLNDENRVFVRSMMKHHGVYDKSHDEPQDHHGVNDESHDEPQDHHGVNDESHEPQDHHGVNDDSHELQDHHGVNDDSHDESQTKSDSLVRNRERVIESWIKLCGDDDDCLDDYLELFQKQQGEIKRRVVRDLLSVI